MRFNKGSLIFNPMLFNETEIAHQPFLNRYIFDTVVNDVERSAKNAAPQHFVILGPHGSGKTTLLLRVLHSLRAQSNVGRNILPVIFNEEEYSIISLDSFFVRAQQHLESSDIDTFGRSLNAIVNEPSDKDPLLVLLIDNFGDLLRRLPYSDQQEFREILIQCKKIQIIGTSSHHLEESQEYATPFYEYFKTLTMENLSHEKLPEFLEYLSFISEDDEGRKFELSNGKAEIFANLTGGNLRLTTLAFHIVTSKTYSETLRELELLLDVVTGPFKATMDSLTSNAAFAVDQLAKSWSGLSLETYLSRFVEDATNGERALLELKSKMLLCEVDQLEDRTTLQLRDRLFNIWYLMRHGGEKGRERTAWFVRFLEDWYLPGELKSVYAGIEDDFLSEDTSSGLFSWLDEISLASSAQGENEISSVTQIVESELDLSKEFDSDSTIPSTIAEAVHAYLTGDVKKAIETLTEHAEASPLIAFLAGAISERSGGEIVEAEAFYQIAYNAGSGVAAYECGLMWRFRAKDIQKSRNWFEKASECGVSSASIQLGNMCRIHEDNLVLAEEHYFNAIKGGNFYAFRFLGDLYAYDYRDGTAAQKYYLVGSEAGDIASINGLGNLAVYFNGSSTDAEKYFLRAIDKGSVNAINNIACLYAFEHGELDTAEEYFIQAMEAGHSRALSNLALMYKRTGGGAGSKHALHFAERFLRDREDPESQFLYTILICRGNQVDRAVALFTKLVRRQIEVNGEMRMARTFLMQLIALEQFDSLRRIKASSGGVIERAFAPVFEASQLFESRLGKNLSCSESASTMPQPTPTPIVSEILSEVEKLKIRLG